jgi:hypothetical protein
MMVAPTPEPQRMLAKVHAELKEAALLMQPQAADKVKIEYYFDALFIYCLYFLFSFSLYSITKAVLPSYFPPSVTE